MTKIQNYKRRNSHFYIYIFVSSLNYRFFQEILDAFGETLFALCSYKHHNVTNGSVSQLRAINAIPSEVVFLIALAFTNPNDPSVALVTFNIRQSWINV